MNYIDLHIREKQRLSVEHIAEHFNIRKAYFNQYFNRVTGRSYKKYIQEYALNLIARQLVHGRKTLSELAYEFGYSDESHLSNSFKAHFGQSPSALKKSVKIDGTFPLY
ncbi:MAG: AraC family transcriptional regulator [Bacteroidota bacterium]|nr:AraC family transcriptional regulator [Bacteroidota bacterium]